MEKVVIFFTPSSLQFHAWNKYMNYTKQHENMNNIPSYQFGKPQEAWDHALHLRQRSVLFISEINKKKLSDFATNRQNFRAIVAIIFCKAGNAR